MYSHWTLGLICAISTLVFFIYAIIEIISVFRRDAHSIIYEFTYVEPPLNMDTYGDFFDLVKPYIGVDSDSSDTLS